MIHNSLLLFITCEIGLGFCKRISMVRHGRVSVWKNVSKAWIWKKKNYRKLITQSGSSLTEKQFLHPINTSYFYNRFTSDSIILNLYTDLTHTHMHRRVMRPLQNPVIAQWSLHDEQDFSLAFLLHFLLQSCCFSTIFHHFKFIS